MKVGFFDSGVGGTCILRAFRRLCPDVATEYLADTAHCPYGNKPPEEVVRLSVANTEELLRRGCGVVVVACNTATAAAIDVLRAHYPQVPFVGVEPALKPAALRTRTGVVGVLATAGTFHGRLYNETKARYAKDVAVIAAVADEFVEIVEEWKSGEVEKWRSGEVEEWGSGEVEEWKSGRMEEWGSLDEEAPMDEALRARAERAVRERVVPLLDAGADCIVLGCTHFPHLKPFIEAVCTGRAEVIDPSDAVARQIRRAILDSRVFGQKRNAAPTLTTSEEKSMSAESGPAEMSKPSTHS